MAIDPALLEQIRTNDPDLTALILPQTNFTDTDATILADALKRNHTISGLDLGGNVIGDAGATALADALKVNRTLTELTLWKNSIGNVGASALASALKNNHTLIQLELSSNDIGAAGAIALADALKKNRTLAIVYLDYNFIGEAGIIALADALITSKNILYIDPSTEELKAHCEENKTIAIDLIERIQNDPDKLTQNERKEIQDRIPAILTTGHWNFNIPIEQTLAMLAGIGIKPVMGPMTNKVREAQRQAAIEDPSQGI